MTTGINTHSYTEAINVTHEFIKSGEGSFLWGLWTWPIGKWVTTKHYLGICHSCGKEEFIPAHGYHKVDSFK